MLISGVLPMILVPSCMMSTRLMNDELTSFSAKSAFVEDNTVSAVVNKKENDGVVLVPTADLSHVGRSIYDCLRTKHSQHRGTLWNLTTGSVVGAFHQTPAKAFHSMSEPSAPGHDDWFPVKMGEILSRCENYADVLSLRPPDGLFMEEFRAALKTIAAKKRRDHKIVTIRMMFGNVLGWPVDCEAAVQELTRSIPETTNIRLWVAAWRNHCSWNHAKLIAVDGKWLHTGGHNMWSQHYLKVNPLHDVSVELSGNVAQDGHAFANTQWSFVEHGDRTLLKTCVSMSCFPKQQAAPYPPPYTRDRMSSCDTGLKHNPKAHILTIGKCGPLAATTARPSNDAILALLGSAEKSIKLAIQDIGPRCLPIKWVQIPYPCHPWPAETLSILAHAIWKKGVQVDIVLSNRGAICGGLPASDTLARPNGWTLQQVVDEISKAIRKEFPDSQDAAGMQKIRDRLRVCGLKQLRGDTYADGTKMGMHTKCFIVDEVTSYMGSQNLYMCDLAEWGVVIDDKATTRKLIDEYWSPMWQCSYKG